MDSFRIFFFGFALNAPYYLLCCIPFLNHLRVRPAVLVTMVLGTSLLVGAYYALRQALLPQAQWMDTLVLLLFYAAYLMQYRRYFDLTLPRLFYIFLIVQAYANLINITAKFIAVRLYPQQAAVLASLPYGVANLVLMALTLPLLYYLFRGPFRAAMTELSDRNFWQLCITPVLFFLINLLYTNVFVRYAFADAAIFTIYALLLFTGFVTYYVTVRTALDTVKSARVAAENRNMERQLALQVENYRQLTDSIGQARAARHDLRHHLAVMTAYLEEGDQEGLRQYLETYRANLTQETLPVQCANYAVDAIVRHYLAPAHKAGVRLDLRLALPEDVGVPDADLCIIFGNLFENAARAVCAQRGEDRFLSARCEARAGRLVLTVDNTAAPGPQPPGGLGQQSVKAVAEKYQGAARFEQQDGVYRASIMLLLPKAAPQP